MPRAACWIRRALVASAVVAAGLGPSVPSGASSTTQGVTSGSIRIGITYVDLASVAQFTHNLSQGNYKAVYQALIDAINKSGGIDGRKLHAYYEAVSPLGSAPAAAACTQLTEDDQVFAVLGFFENDDPLCYVQLHQVPIIGGTMTTQQLASAKAAWFSTSPIDNHLEVAAVRVAAKAGVFRGKKVAVMSLSSAPAGLSNSVIGALEKSGVKPVATATVIENFGDPIGSLQQIGVVAEKFQAAGATVVVPVGQAALTWGDATAGGTYHPHIVAPSFSAIATYATGQGADPAVMDGAVSVSTLPAANGTKSVGWSDPAMQQCLHTVEAAGQRVLPPTVVHRNGNDSYVSVAVACQDLALFKSIALKAGKDLTAGTFWKAGDSLGSVHVPGLGNVTYSKATPGGLVPIYLYHWNQAQQTWMAAPTPSGTAG